MYSSKDTDKINKDSFWNICISLIKMTRKREELSVLVFGSVWGWKGEGIERGEVGSRREDEEEEEEEEECANRSKKGKREGKRRACG